jgi:dihydrodipicolinate synthase/N-acetylneuraminate lyase
MLAGSSVAAPAVARRVFNLMMRGKLTRAQLRSELLDPLMKGVVREAVDPDA